MQNLLKSILTAFFIIGFSSAIFQVIAIREFLNAFLGNELIFGMILACWLLLVALGSLAGNYTKSLKDSTCINLFIILQLSLAVLALLMVFLARMVRGLLYVRGELIGPAQCMLISLIILLPICLTLGFLFTLTSKIVSGNYSNNQSNNHSNNQINNPKNKIRAVYICECLGSVTGGLLFSFAFVAVFSNIQIIFFIISANILAALGIAVIARKKALCTLAVFQILLCICFGSFWMHDFDRMTIQAGFPGQKLLSVSESRFGRIVVTKLNHQLNFFENSILLFSSGDKNANEEIAHYPLAQLDNPDNHNKPYQNDNPKNPDKSDKPDYHDNPDNVLLIFGGVSGSLDELRKHNVHIDYIEVSPQVISLAKKYI